MAPNPNNPVDSEQPPGMAVEVVKVEADPTPEEKAQVKSWLDTLRKESKAHEDLWKEMRKNRNAAAGQSEYAVKVNLHQSTLETLLPLLYAQDPDVEVKPQDSVNPARYAELRPFCRTLEIVLSRELRDADLKGSVERCIRAAKTVSFGVLKVIFQTDSENDPFIVRRIADVQDNMQRVAMLAEQVAGDGGQCPDDIDKRRADLQDTLAALQAKVEVLKSIGVVLDFVLSDDWIVPMSVAELKDAKHAPWQAQRIWMTKDEAVSKFGLTDDQAKKLTTYPCRKPISDEDDARETGVDSATKSAEKSELCCSWEAWDRRNQTVYTLLEGLDDRYAKPPFAPSLTGQRFFPYFMLAFSWVDGKREPLSAVGMADPLVQEYNATRSGYREHRENCIPAGFFDKSIMDKDDAERIAKRDRIELVGIDANGANVSQAMGVLQYPQVDMGLYDTSIIRGEVDIIYGVQDAMRGVVTKAKTATEADIMQQGLGARTTGQRGEIESWLQEIADYTAEVLLLAMPTEQVEQIAGDGYVWPQLSRADIQNLVQVQIRAGSTGKPDKQKDAEEWTNLLPQLMPVIQQYVQAQMQSQPGIAEALKAVIVETLRRFDDRIDAEQFLPKVIPPTTTIPPATNGLPPGPEGLPPPDGMPSMNGPDPDAPPLPPLPLAA